MRGSGTAAGMQKEPRTAAGASESHLGTDRAAKIAPGIPYARSLPVSRVIREPRIDAAWFPSSSARAAGSPRAI